jgi:hypothetical protein
MCRLFHLIVHPLATVKTPGAFLGGLRIMAIDVGQGSSFLSNGDDNSSGGS